AGARAGVAGRSLLIDREQDRVTVAVDGDAVHPLRVARGVTLAPVLLAGPGPVHGPPAGEGAAQRLGVHPGEHEHLAPVVLLHGHGREAVGVPDDPVDIALHAYRSTTPDPRSACLASPTVSCPLWNTLAASPASAPASMAGAKCVTSPAPPEAMTGTAE